MSDKRVLLFSITFFSIVSLLYCIGKTDRIKAEIWLVEEQTVEARQKIERYKKLDEIFGTASETFYASTPILFLKAGGDANSMTVYSDKEAKYVVAAPSSTEIVGQWAARKSWNGRAMDYIVTPPDHSGYYTVHFMNKLNSEEFDVLVVVE